MSDPLMPLRDLLALHDRNLRVFVSSTFRDLHAERDYLAKAIFPQLRAKAERRGAVWTDVDLRWGITDEQAAEGQVLPICLNEIERCRPCFMAILGYRYGWIPDRLAESVLARHPWLAETSGCSVTELEIRAALRAGEHGEPMQAFFYLLDAPTPPDTDVRALALRRAVDGGAFPVRRFRSPEELGDLVLSDWSAVIDARFAQQASEESPRDDRREESSRHHAFFRTRAALADGKVGPSIDVPRAVLRGKGKVVVIAGDAGTGKSVAISRWLLEEAQRAAGLTRTSSTLSHRLGRWLGRAHSPFRGLVFLSTASAATDAQHWEATLTRFLRAVRAQLPLLSEPDVTAQDLVLAFGQALHATGREHGLLLVLDAIDALDADAASPLAWLPESLPPHVTIVCSARPGAALDELRRRGAMIHDMAPLDAPERRAIISRYLAGFGKSFPAAMADTLARAPIATRLSPLMLALDELRLAGVHEHLGEQVRALADCESTEQVLHLVLTRMEQDGGQTPTLLSAALSSLAVARAGLTEDEVLHATGSPSGPTPYRHWAPLRAALAVHLLDVDGRLVLGSSELRSVVATRYLSTSTTARGAHQRLVHAYRTLGGERAIQDMPWHLADAGRWPQAIEEMTAPRYLRRVWDKSAADAAALWLRASRETGITPEAAYAPLLHAPERDDDLTLRVVGLLRRIGRLDAACEVADGLLHEVPPTSHHHGYHELVYAAILSHRQAGHIGRALHLLEQHRELLRSVSNSRSRAGLLALEGVLLRDAGRYQEARERHRAEAEVFSSLNDVVAVARSEVNQAAIYLLEGEITSAERLIDRAEPVLARAGDAFALQGLHEIRGAALLASGKRAKALERFRTAEALCRGLAYPRGVARAKLRQASALHEMLDFDAALLAVEESAALSQRSRDFRTLVEALILKAAICLNGGAARLAVGTLAEAEQWLNTAALAEHAALRREWERACATARPSLSR